MRRLQLQRNIFHQSLLVDERAWQTLAAAGLALQRHRLYQHLRAWVLWSLAYFSPYLSLAALAWAIWGSFTYNEFDGALRLLAHTGAQQQWRLYADLGIVYPPGLAWFTAFFAPQNLWQRHLLLSGTVLLFLLCCFEYWRLIRLHLKLPQWRTTLFALGILSWPQFFGSDPLIMPMLTLLFLAVFYAFLAKSMLSLAISALLAFFIVFLRWDWPIIFASGWLFFALCGLFGLSWSRASHDDVVWLWRAAVLLFLSMTGGLAMLTATIFFSGVSPSTLWEWLVALPILVIGPYRQLAPVLTFRIWQPEALNVVSLVVVGMHSSMLLYQACKRGHSPSVLLLPLLFPGSLMMYAVGHADWMHGFPLWSATYATLALAPVSFNSRIILVFATALFLSASMILTTRPSWDKLQPGRAITSLARELADCRSASLRLPHPGSIFVARADYSHYIYSTSALYLVRPSVPPATAFVSDEPGIQNSSRYGQRIVSNLQSATRPLLVFVAVTPQHREKNRTESMTSNGTIERYLHEHPFSLQGTCVAYNKHFEIRVYE